ncbi:hypothetical protein BH10PSE12_BH10PSE12_20440 [soil metagenome]
MTRLTLASSAQRLHHRFRRELPAHVLTPLADSKARADENDWKLFVLSFSAFFTVFYSFIA